MLNTEKIDLDAINKKEASKCDAITQEIKESIFYNDNFILS